MAAGSEANYIMLVVDEDDGYYKVPLEENSLKESVLNNLFPQSIGLFFKDHNNARTLVIKRGDSFIEPSDGWNGETRKYHLLKKTETQQEKIRSLAEAIRCEKAGQNKRKSLQPPNVNQKNKKKESDIVAVRFQWMHYNESKYSSKKGYKQVFACDGGGTREFQMDRNVKNEEILQKAKEIYFEGGKSTKGTIEEMKVEIADFTLQPIKYFTDLNGVECTYKTHLSCRGLFPSRSSVILMTKKDTNTCLTSQEENISTNTKRSTGCSGEIETSIESRMITTMNIDTCLIKQQGKLATNKKKRTNECSDETATVHETTIKPTSFPSSSTMVSIKNKLKLIEISTIKIKYVKQKPSLYSMDNVSINVIGRNQVKEVLQQENGIEVSDPLDSDFNIHHISKDGRVYLDAKVSPGMLKETVVGLEYQSEETQIKFVFPNDSSNKNSIIVHGPNEIFGIDGDELVIGVVCRNHGTESLLYRWFKNDELIKCGNKYVLLAIKDTGTYYCQVEDGTRRQNSEKIIFEELKESPRGDSKGEQPLIPIIAVTDLHFSKADEIGKGAFARVYKGSWIGSCVAIKIVELKKRSQNKIKSMVEEEIKIHSKIRHPNIVQLMAVAYDVCSIFLVSEFINGFNMEDVIFDDNVKIICNLTFQNKFICN